MATTAEPLSTRRRSARIVNREKEAQSIKQEEAPTTQRKAPKRKSATSATSGRRSKRVKVEEDAADPALYSASPSTPSPPPPPPPAGKPRTKRKPDTTDNSSSSSPPPTTKSKEAKAADLQAKKLRAYAQHATTTPFPDFARPTPAECKLAHGILARVHGARARPDGAAAAPRDAAGCGASPSVLDALVRTILSQNTSDKNSARAKRSMDAVYGGSDRWEAIAAGGQAKLQEAIASGGLAAIKSRVIVSILDQAREKYGAYSLDHLFGASDDDAMREMLAFQGVGPKTASCVLLFCLRRESFAVDTHVHRITGLLGWRPPGCSRDEAHAHLNARVPDEDKYGLHVLLVSHGKVCEECKAGGKNVGKCQLRKAFRGGKVAGLAGEDMKLEEIEHIKKEDQAVKTDRVAIAHAVEQAA